MKLSILCLVLLPLSALAAQMGDIVQPLEKVGQYGLCEIGVSSRIPYENPYDPTEVSLNAKLVSPSGREREVNGYWDGHNWRLRFCEGELGHWKYQVSLQDKDSTATAKGGFEVVASDREGWVGISKDDPRYLVRSGGKSYYGVGVAVPWFLNPTRYGYYRPYGDVLGQLEKSGCNLFYYMLPHWGNNIVSMESGYDAYDQTHCGNIDTIVRQAEDKGITIVFTVWMHDVIRDAAHPWSADNVAGWAENPFNALTDCKGFFTASKSWKYQQNLYRYIIARWGYSPAIAFWHTVAEVDGTGAIYADGAIGSGEGGWFRKLNEYFQLNDPFDHPTTASMSGDRWWPEANELSDAVQIHTYDHQNDTDGIADRVGYWSRRMFLNHEKPALVGEFGKPRYEKGDSERFVHDGIWASLVNGGAITPLHWWGGYDNGATRSDWDQFTPSMFDQLSHLRTFVDTIDMPTQNFRVASSTDWNPPLAVSAESVEASGLFGDTVSVFWLQGKGNDCKLSISDLEPGKYEARFYDTWSGKWIGDKNMKSDSFGRLDFDVPDFERDIAVRLERTAGGSPAPVKVYALDNSKISFEILGASDGSPSGTIDDFDGHADTEQLLEKWRSNDEGLKLSLVEGDAPSEPRKAKGMAPTERRLPTTNNKALKLAYSAGYLQATTEIDLIHCNKLWLRFKGDKNNSPGQLLVRFVHDTPEGEKSLADFYNASAPIKEGWETWEINCSGIDFSKVQRINLGVFSGEGCAGEVLIDDIEFVGDIARAEFLDSNTCLLQKTPLQLELLTSGNSSIKLVTDKLKLPKEFSYVEFAVYVPQLPNGLCAKVVAMDSFQRKTAFGRTWPLVVGRVNILRISKVDLNGMDLKWLGLEFGGTGVDFSGKVELWKVGVAQ